MDLKKSYEVLAKKYKLPSYDELDYEFELLLLGTVIEIPFPLRFVRRRINERIGWTCNIIQAILQPNPSSLISVQESNFFSKEDKGNIATLLKELMALERSSLSLDLNFDEKNDAEMITKLLKSWRQYKPQIIKISEKLRDGWEHQQKETTKREQYFG